MSPSPTDLLRDPLFQLNTVLWLAQPLPSGGTFDPLFYRKGFRVYALGPPLTLPLDLQLAAQKANIAVKGSTRPDVILEKRKDRVMALAECKKSSFGPESSNSVQARCQLLVAGDRAAEALNIPPEEVSGCIAGSFVPEDQRLPLVDTLDSLSEELRQHELFPGPHSVFGFLAANGGLSLVVDSTGTKYFDLKNGANRFADLDQETDPRPLYFIPFDPDVDQSSEEKSRCKRLLFERIHSAVVAGVGKANPPVDLILQPDNLLNDATFGMFRNWENPTSGKKMRRLCKEFMRAFTMLSTPAFLDPSRTSLPKGGWCTCAMTASTKRLWTR